MNRFAFLSCFLLTACSHQPDGVRLTHDQPTPSLAAPAPVPQARTEPVFYNGKIYNFTINPEAGGYALNISGMSAAQGKDANAVAVTSLHHFACKDSQKARFTGAPTYVSGLWQFHGNCA